MVVLLKTASVRVSFIQIMQIRVQNKSKSVWKSRYDGDVSMSPYEMVYGKACHLPLELEYKAYWAIKELNYDFKLAGEKRLFDISSLDEWRTQAYENAKLFK